MGRGANGITNYELKITNLSTEGRLKITNSGITNLSTGGRLRTPVARIFNALLAYLTDLFLTALRHYQCKKDLNKIGFKPKKSKEVHH